MPTESFDIQIIRQYRRIGLPASLIRRTAVLLLRQLGWRKAVLSLFFVSDARIRVLNRKFFGRNRATDVIAFSQLEGSGPRTLIGTKPFLGDVIISLSTTRRQARQYGNAFNDELCLYVCHGILHLMGYEDKTLKGRAKIERLQKSLLRKAGILI